MVSSQDGMSSSSGLVPQAFDYVCSTYDAYGDSLVEARGTAFSE
jgi:hypothetical protein